NEISREPRPKHSKIRPAPPSSAELKALRDLSADAPASRLRRSCLEQGHANRASAWRQRAPAWKAIRLDGRKDPLRVVWTSLRNFRRRFSETHLHGGGLPLLSRKKTVRRRSSALTRRNRELRALAP